MQDDMKMEAIKKQLDDLQDEIARIRLQVGDESDVEGEEEEPLDDGAMGDDMAIEEEPLIKPKAKPKEGVMVAILGGNKPKPKDTAPTPTIEMAFGKAANEKKARKRAR